MPTTRNRPLAGTAKARRRYSGGFSFPVCAGHFPVAAVCFREFLRSLDIVGNRTKLLDSVQSRWAAFDGFFRSPKAAESVRTRVIIFSPIFWRQTFPDSVRSSKLMWTSISK
jgi:hypothetical protein